MNVTSIRHTRTVAKFELFIDARVWRDLQGLMTEKLDLDYTSLFGGSKETISASDLMARWQKFVSPLKATQHMITNVHITVKDDGTAKCVADVMATHVRPNNMGDWFWTVGGRYDFQLKREEKELHISSIKLITQWTTGNPQISNS